MNPARNPELEALSQQIEEDTQTYVENGGEIEQVPIDHYRAFNKVKDTWHNDYMKRHEV